MKKVPVKGAWLACIPISLAAFFMNLRQLAQLCSLCNLMTYAFIDAAVLTLRLKEVTTEEELEVELVKEEVRRSLQSNSR